MKTKSTFDRFIDFFKISKKPLDQKDIIPMSTELKKELRTYVRSKNMSLANYFIDDQLDKMSFNSIKKSIDELIEISNKHSYG